MTSLMSKKQMKALLPVLCAANRAFVRSARHALPAPAMHYRELAAATTREHVQPGKSVWVRRHVPVRTRLVSRKVAFAATRRGVAMHRTNAVRTSVVSAVSAIPTLWKADVFLIRTALQDLSAIWSKCVLAVNRTAHTRPEFVLNQAHAA